MSDALATTHYLGIVGAEAAKFTEPAAVTAQRLIREWLENDEHAVVVSGHCHLGGVDLWAEYAASSLSRPSLIYAPRTHVWSTGYKPRNELIADKSAEVRVIVVNRYPPNFEGMRFEAGCYHCRGALPFHVKSGGCWTARLALKLGKVASWYIIDNPTGAWTSFNFNTLP